MSRGDGRRNTHHGKNTARYLEALKKTNFADAEAVRKLNELYKRLFGRTDGWELDQSKGIGPKRKIEE